MPFVLSTSEKEFESQFSAFVRSRRKADAKVEAEVAAIIEDVRSRGDAALAELTRKFDRYDLESDGIAFSPRQIDEAVAGIPDADKEALDLALERVRAYHRHQAPDDVRWTDPQGVELGWRWTPLESAGVYVPGGSASYPSSVVMNVCPAQVAGVRRMAMASPTPGGAANSLMLLAARLSGVETIYRIGGAQAIAAFAYGTQSVDPVDKITGPGNAYVAEAKRQVFGHVGIDMVAGPSEVVVVADRGNDPAWIAADLIAQAEHDAAAQAVLITDDCQLARRVEAEVPAQIAKLPRRIAAGASWRDYGAVIVSRDLHEAVDLSNRISPEHLQICVEDPESLLSRIDHAGAVFLGPWTPEAIGDYVGGPSHVLPTSGAARYASGLSVLDFVKRMTVTGVSEKAFAAIGPAAEALAGREGLDGHRYSVRLRLDSAMQARN